MNVKEGEYLLAVSGKDLKAPTEVYLPFENTAGKLVEITDEYLMVDLSGKGRAIFDRLELDLPEEPAQGPGSEIDDAVVSDLLEAMGDRQDQLPIVQHALAQLWKYAAPSQDAAGNDLHPSAPRTITTAHAELCKDKTRAAQSRAASHIPARLEWVTDAITTPTAAGEELYLWDGFREMIEKRAVDIIHPDLATSGGILETKRIGDRAQEFGVPMAMHFAGTPISFMANVHCAAATENFLVLENHSVDIPWWSDLVEGVSKPIVDHGFITEIQSLAIRTCRTDAVGKDVVFGNVPSAVILPDLVLEPELGFGVLRYGLEIIIDTPH
mgnify:CR=1 FL=1